MKHDRRQLLLCLGASLVLPMPAMSETKFIGTLLKTPGCSCCDGHAQHLSDYGFNLQIVETEDLDVVKRRHGVPPDLDGCHTIVIGEKVLEGHVPGDVALDFLSSKESARGVALAGMPEGSPGMSGVKREPFRIMAFGDGPVRLFATR